MKKIKLLLVSKSFIIKESLSKFFKDEFQAEVVEIVSNLDNIKIDYISEFDLLFIDLKSECDDLVSILKQIKDKLSDLKILILDRSKDRELFIKYTDLNIEGYILDIEDKEELVYIVNRVINGKHFYDSEILESTIKNQYDVHKRELTNREKEVFREVSKGFSNKDIAKKIGVTEYTVKKHISSILNKLNLSSRKDIIDFSRMQKYNNDLYYNFK